MQICISKINAQQTYQLDWGFNINGANASLTIEQGDTVEWTWIDTGQHNVVNTANAVETFDSGLLQGVGATFSHTFTEIGVNDYECSPHNNNMFGTITVTAPANNNFYLAPNGVTCMCPNAAVGDSGDPGDGVVYTKRERNEITPQNAATTCTSGITEMDFLFIDYPAFNADISTWDVSNATIMQQMFEGCLSFNQDLSYWDVSNVTSMSFMFASTNFNQDINTWDVSSVTDMQLMFFDTPFNQALDAWDVSNVINMNSMFARTSNFNQDISSWDVSGNGEFGDMFYLASSFNQDISSWDMSNAVYINSMFEQAWEFNQDLGSWDVSNATDIFQMFNGASSFDQDLSSWIFNEGAFMHLFLNNSGMSTENYDLLLQSMYAQPLFNKEFGDAGLTYCNVTDHDALITEKGWQFSGGTLLSPSIFGLEFIQSETDPGLCVATNVDLGQPSTEGCGVLTITNDAPAEFPLGITTVTWTLVDGNGTTVTDTQQVEVIMVADEADVCYVSADQNQPTLNRVFTTSDPTLNGQNVDFHEVLRETPSGGYETIGFIVPPEDSFLDATSNNNTQAYRYKVQTTDVCSQVLNLSDFHKTILLQSSIATNNSVNLAWNPYIGVAFNTYNIYRSVNGANYELLTSISSTNTSYNDTSANVVDNFYEYYISIDVASCGTNPLQSFELESNREFINPNLSIGENNWLENAISLYPNPASALINISALEGVEVRSITLYSALGQRIMNVEGSNSIDVSILPSGVYYMAIETDQGKVNKTLVRK